MNFNWEKIVDEMYSNIPELIDTLLAIGLATNSSPDKVKHLLPRLGVCYGLLMQNRSHCNSLLQRTVTMILTEGGVSKKVCRFN